MRTETAASLPPGVIEEQMNRLLDQSHAELPSHQVPGLNRPVSLPGCANLLDPDGNPLFDRAPSTRTVEGSFFDLAANIALRQAQVKTESNLSGHTLITTMEISPLSAMLAWQTKVRKLAHATPMSVHPALFTNTTKGISRLQEHDYWPYRFVIAHPSAEIFERGSNQLNGFRRSHDTGFRYDPELTPPKLMPQRENPTNNNIDFGQIDIEEISKKAMDHLKEIIETARQLKASHADVGRKHSGDIPIISALIDPEQVGEELVWHATSDQIDNDSSQHAEIKTLIAEEIRRGKGNLAGKILYTTLEPCAMCAIACHQAEVAVVYAINTKTLRDKKPDLFSSSKMALEELEAQENWPFNTPHKKASARVGRRIVELMSLFNRDESGLYFLES